MIPIKDDNPQINVPYATYLFVFLNIVVWIFVQNLGLGLEHEMSVCKFGLIPSTFQEQGIESSCLDLNDWGYFSVISSMFLHGNWMHLLGNLLFLWVFGGNVEDSMGTYRFTAFYLLVGVFAGFSHIITNMGSSVPMIGASGAIGGVMGAYLMLFPKVKVHIFVPIFIIFWTFRILKRQHLLTFLDRPDRTTTTTTTTTRLPEAYPRLIHVPRGCDKPLRGP